MLETELLHPPLLAALAAAGHGDHVVITDANFPLRTATERAVDVVHLNLSPGLVGVLDVLEPVLRAVPVEAATFMASPDGAEVEAHRDYRRTLGADVAIDVLDRWAFYDRTRSPGVAVVVVTGDQRLCANVVLTLGVRTA